MSDKHTPGPWKIQWDPRLEEIVAIGPVTPGVWVESFEDHEVWLDVGEADANLIAAAPELLEALDWLVLIARGELSDLEFKDAIDTAERVLAAARGEVGA